MNCYNLNFVEEKIYSSTGAAITFPTLQEVTQFGSLDIIVVEGLKGFLTNVANCLD